MLGKALSLKQETTRLLTAISLVSFLISIGWTLGEWRYPWLFQALNARHIFFSYRATDVVDPRYPLKLPLAIYKAEKAKLEAEERRHTKTLEEITKRREQGLPETKQERELIEEAKRELETIRKEMEKMRIVSGDVKTPGIFSAFALSSKLIIFGIMVLAPGMIFNKRSLKGFGIALLIGGIGWYLFGQEVSGTIKKVSIQPRVPHETVDTKTISITLKPGEEISYQVPPKHWFRIYSDQNVVATTWSGRPIPDLSWLGDEVRDANFKLKSKEKEKDATVIITLRPK